MFDIADTIIARASAPGVAPRGIVRLSGVNALHLADQLLLPLERSGQQRARCEQRRWMSKPFGCVECMVLTWPTGHSYTGQPVVEFHLPGSEPMLAALIRECVALGARPARAGEFTLRAFLAGRMDLAQCEGVLGVIDARNEHELTDALRQLAGGMTAPLHELRERLLELLAEIEAGLDFADEDLEFVSPERLTTDVGQAMIVVNDALERMQRRRLATPQHRVVLVGLPNVGKSSLLNALVGTAATIVSPLAGTTRDWVSVETEHDGLAVHWIDTPGYDPTSPSVSDATSQIEHAAQQLAHSIIESAELRLICFDLSRVGLTEWEEAWLSDSSSSVLFVGTKADAKKDSTDIHPDLIPTSAESGVGIDRLRQRVLMQLASGSCRSSSAEFLPATAERCAVSLNRAQKSLQRCQTLIGTGREELLAAELRIALEGIGDVTGQVYNDEVLDRIFSRFCIGK